MKMVKTKLALGAAVAALALSAGTSANAITVTWGAAGTDSAAAGETVIFDGSQSPFSAGYTLTATPVSGNSLNQYAEPANNDSPYYYVDQALGTASLTAPGVLSSISFYIGSLDSFNTISFFNQGDHGTAIASYTGSQLAAMLGGVANGSSVDPNQNRRFFFDFSGDGVDYITFSSTTNSLEFDNVAVSAVPEPGVWALMIAGFGMLGGALRRRRTAVASLA